MQKYTVNWKATGYTAPDDKNPKGIKVTANGFVEMDGERPKTNTEIPSSAAVKAKKVFMKTCNVVRYQGDDGFQENFPILWLGKKNK